MNCNFDRGLVSQKVEHESRFPACFSRFVPILGDVSDAEFFASQGTDNFMILQ